VRSGARARVLVADDHQALLDRVAAILAPEFSVIGKVTDGAQLVAAAAALHPDVLVVDIWMPGMTGLEAAAQLRSRGSQVPVVCLTACSVSDMLEAAWAAGAAGFVLKTAVARDLVPAVRAVLDGRRFVSDSDSRDAAPAR
jgi:DNA-binding NarL/FixJ family response regulator